MTDTWRKNPFSGNHKIKTPTLTRFVKLLDNIETDQSGPVYGFYLPFVPVITSPATTVAVYADYLNYGDPLTEIAHSQTPVAGEFRIDYEADGQNGTALVECHLDDLDRLIEITFAHTGTLAGDELIGSLTRPNRLSLVNCYRAAPYSNNPGAAGSVGDRLITTVLSGSPGLKHGQVDGPNNEAFRYTDDFINWNYSAAITRQPARVDPIRVYDIKSHRGTVLAVGSYDPGTGYRSVTILRSPDHGLTWTELDIPETLYNKTPGGQQVIDCKQIAAGNDTWMILLTQSEGLGTWGILKSVDDGQNWTYIAMTNMEFLVFGGVTGSSGWFLGVNNLDVWYESVDDGQNWTTHTFTTLYGQNLTSDESGRVYFVQHDNQQKPVGELAYIYQGAGAIGARSVFTNIGTTPAIASIKLFTPLAYYKEKDILIIQTSLINIPDFYRLGIAYIYKSEIDQAASLSEITSWASNTVYYDGGMYDQSTIPDKWGETNPKSCGIRAGVFFCDGSIMNSGLLRSTGRID